MARSRTAGRGPVTALDADDAFIALLIAAMEASGHTSVAEAARAHHIIWSMRRFRRRSGSSVGRRIERMRALVAQIDSQAARLRLAVARRQHGDRSVIGGKHVAVQGTFAVVLEVAAVAHVAGNP